MLSEPTDAINIQAVLSFWLGEDRDLVSEAKANQKRWFSSNKTFDRLISDQFGTLLRRAEAGQLNHWQAADEGAVALIILLDQFSRNIYRGTADAFKNDSKALDVASALVLSARDKRLKNIERVFVYLPFEHAEDVEQQNTSVALFNSLKVSASADWQPILEGFHQHALDHQAIIATYGRFPHRNNLLGRTNTQDEENYFATGGRSFGQASGHQGKRSNPASAK